MFRWLRKVFRLCEHEFVPMGSQLHWGQPCFIEGCSKCWRLRYVPWHDGSNG